MKKIAIVNYHMGESDTIGGIEKVLLNFLCNLDYSLVCVDLFLLQTSGGLLKKIPNQVNVYVIPSNCGGKERITNLIKEHKFVHLVRSFSLLLLSKMFNSNTILHYYRKYDETLSQEKYDTVISFHGGANEVLIPALFRLKSNNKICVIHGDFGKNVKSFFYNKIKTIVCVSKGIEKIFLSNYPKCQGKTMVINNLLDIELINKKSRQEVNDMIQGVNDIVTIARISFEKGIQLIPGIARLLLNENYVFNWYIVGDGPMKNEIIQRCVELKVDNCVHFLGAKDNPYPYINKCKIYVQPSLSEGYCTASNEAKILLKPCVVTPVSGMDEQFQNRINGIIVEACNEESIFDGIKLLLNSPFLRESIETKLKKGNNQKDILDAWYGLIL